MKSLLLKAIAIGSAVFIFGTIGAQAAILDPRAFASLGDNPFTAIGDYTVNTGNGIPQLILPSGAQIDGIVFGGVAVFTFSNLTIWVCTLLKWTARRWRRFVWNVRASHLRERSAPRPISCALGHFFDEAVT